MGSMMHAGIQGSKHGIGTGVAPKKKDPYATAWRTYSKIAEELNLLNPDGSLYPISKDAILKYLRHQSKRIKSSNLHWYVNGLKKHQENLGFAWDDVRYDEQVVALLKELTVHPVSIDQAAAAAAGLIGYPHQGRSSTISSHSGPIDSAKIASLSQHYSHSQQKHQQQQPPFSASFGVGSKRYPQDQYEEGTSPVHSYSRPSHQQHQQYSERIELPLPQSSKRSTPFHSAPIQLPSQHTRDDQSAPETPQPRYKSHSQSLGDISPAGSLSTTSSPMSSSEIQPIPQTSPNGNHVKRKRHDPTSEKLAHLVSPKSLDGDELEGNESNSRGSDNLDMEALEDMDEDHRERTPLKRHASTGTLRSQARMAGLMTMTPDDQHFQQEYPVTTPSPSSRENESGGHFRWGTSDSSIHSRLSPGSSIGSPSPASRSAAGSSSGSGSGTNSSQNRHRRANGVVSSPISTVATAIASATGSSAGNIPPMPSQSIIGGNGNKNTVQFSEVVEYAQLLQTKYGKRCKKHLWGCVELSEDHHIELTIKMYMDWAGLVASGRLTMDEIPDLPEFRQPVGSSDGDNINNGGRSDASPLPASPSSSSPTPGPAVVSGSILKRTPSTPLTTTFSSFSLSQNQPSSPTLKSEDEGREFPVQFTFEHEGGSRSGESSSIRHRQRSMSGSPAVYGHREGFTSDSLMSRIGSPPPQHKIPSLPSSVKSSSGSNSGSTSSMSESARARARRMVSSPSLSRQFSFEHGSGFSSPPQAPPPPVPSFPPSFAKGPIEPPSRRSQKNEMAYNSADSSPHSEDMELSGDEAPVRRMDRRDERRNVEEMEDERMFDGRQQGRQYLRHDNRGSLSGQHDLDDHDERFDQVKGALRNGKFEPNQWKEDRRYQLGLDYAEEREREAYATSNKLSRKRQDDWKAYASHNDNNNEDSRDGDSDQEMGEEGEGKDVDKVEEVRRGIKSLQSSLSFNDDNDNGSIVDGPTNSNADPIATVEMTIVPKPQARNDHDQRINNNQSQIDYSAMENKGRDNDHHDETTSMMET
ncbi:hypothetical protein BGZ46_002815 [Entomortierella lignicola]|nr:hypothetical protein BGZ46_002815 [Entomortierella lignicola]